MLTISGENTAHEDTRATPPDPALDEVSRHIIPDRPLAASLKVIEAIRAHHGVSVSRPVQPLKALIEVKALGPLRPNLRVSIDQVQENVFEELEIKHSAPFRWRVGLRRSLG
jgi:hypothetical protein